MIKMGYFYNEIFKNQIIFVILIGIVYIASVLIWMWIDKD